MTENHEPLFHPASTALIAVDLQRWLGPAYAPHPAGQVVANAARLADAFRQAGSFVVLVRVSSKDFQDLPRPRLDQPAPRLNLMERWDEIVPELGPADTDHIVTKKHWGAFTGTDLDLQLRRRGIDTVVLCGIATGIGVDTTAREAYQLGYHSIFVEDAMTGFRQEEHDHVLRTIFPRIGRIRTTLDILAGFPS